MNDKKRDNTTKYTSMNASTDSMFCSLKNRQNTKGENALNIHIEGCTLIKCKLN